jgi:hypothetical protein
MTINIKNEEHIMLIEIDRPKKYNAMTREMYTQIARAYYQLDRDDNLWVGVVYANGPHFTSGLELTDWSDAFSNAVGFPLSGENEIDPFYMRMKSAAASRLFLPCRDIALPGAWRLCSTRIYAWRHPTRVSLCWKCVADFSRAEERLLD